MMSVMPESSFFSPDKPCRGSTTGVLQIVKPDREEIVSQDPAWRDVVKNGIVMLGS